MRKDKKDTDMNHLQWLLADMIVFVRDEVALWQNIVVIFFCFFSNFALE